MSPAGVPGGRDYWGWEGLRELTPRPLWSRGPWICSTCGRRDLAGVRRARDRGAPSGALARARRVPHAQAEQGAKRRLHQGLGAVHVGQRAHRPRAQLRDRRRVRTLSARARRAGAVRVRLRRVRPAGGAGRDRGRGVPERVGDALRGAYDGPAAAAGVLVRLGADVHELGRGHVPLVAMALPDAAGGGADLPGERQRGLVRHLPDDARDDPGRERNVLALPQPGAADPARAVVPAHQRVRGGERPASGGAGEMGRDVAGEPALRARTGGRRGADARARDGDGLRQPRDGADAADGSAKLDTSADAADGSAKLDARAEDGRGSPIAGEELTVFTPYAEGLEQARFVLMSPKHPHVERWATSAGVQEQLEEMRLGGWERSSRAAETIALVDTGRTLTLPGDERPLPLLISPVVDERFGATAVLGVPALDRTDALIAQRIPGIETDAELGDRGPGGGARAGEEIAGVAAATAVAEAVEPARRITGARATVRYRANDFSISRQRAWGTPIPIVYCERCGTVPIPREQLPVLLPLDLKPTGAGNPLAEREDFVTTDCPSCGGPARRETDTLDCHFDALWLWIPACVPPQERAQPLERILELEDLRAWLPSERLVAGSDSGNFMFDQRVTTKALRDIGPLAFLEQGEPFAGALMHEMVIRDGRKMSKHLGNVVDPDELVETFGADTVRLAVLWAARPQKSLNWSDSAVQYCDRFLHSLWRYSQARCAMVVEDSAELDPASTEFLRRRLEKWCEIAVAKITEDLANLEMHKAVRNVIRLLDRIKDFESRVIKRSGALCREDHAALLDALALMATVLAPFAPHIAQELLRSYGREVAEADPPWPQTSGATLEDDTA